MTKKKKLLFLRKGIARLARGMDEFWEENLQKTSENPTKITPLELPGLANYCEVQVPRRWYSVTNHSRKCFRRKK